MLNNYTLIICQVCQSIRIIIKRQQLSNSSMKSDLITSGRAFQFQFDLEIQKIKLFKNIEIPKSSYLEVIWRRGQKNISTKVKPEVKGTQQQIFFGETLSMISTCLLNSDNSDFSPKQSTVSVVIYIGGSQKLFGSVNINLCSVLQSKSYTQKSVRYIEQQLNGRTKSKIILKLSSTYLKEMMKSDEQSIGSGINANSYNNTSSYSIVERRTIDIIPSKDTYSILSYGGGSIRFSAKKQDNVSINRDESPKKFEEQASKQYGRYGYPSSNFYSKPTNQYNLTQGSGQQALPPNNSNIKSGLSIQGSANRYQKLDSQHNKSAIGQQSSRLLIEQQTKRSKLQAQVTKNRVQNEELKNKLSEYIRENMKLKEQLKKFYDNNDSRQAEIKKQNEELKERNYVLTNQVREIKKRFDKYISMEKQLSNLKSQKQFLARESKKNQEIAHIAKRQLEQLKYQLQKNKQNENKLINEIKEAKNYKIQIEEGKKQNQNKMRELKNQLEYYQSNSKTLTSLLRESQQKNLKAERNLKNAQNQFEARKLQEVRKLNDLLMAKQRQNKQLTEKINLKNQECTGYIIEVQKTKNEYGKLKDEKLAELQMNKSILTQQMQKLSSSLKDAQLKLENLQQQKMAINNNLRMEITMRAKQTEKIRHLQQHLSQLEKKNQKQVNDLRRAAQQVQLQNLELNKILSEKTRSLQQNKQSKQEIQSLMKLNLQLQLEIKYKNEQMRKLMRIEQDHENLKCRYSIQESNLRDLSESLDKYQRELKQKNRSYILECEKTRMLVQERVNNTKTINQIKQQLENAKSIIINGEKQVKDMDYYICELQNRNKLLTDELKIFEQKTSQNNVQKYVNEIKILQTRNKELEARDNEKIKSIENLNRNLNASSNQIKELQIISDQRYDEIFKKQQIINQMEQKIRELSNQKNNVNQEINNLSQQKKNLVKKNEMIMEQLYSYKRKFEEEKGKSYSTAHIRTSEEYIKIKNLQNELQKRDDKIRKMQKQMIELENENVNLSIQVMKKLEDITPN